MIWRPGPFGAVTTGATPKRQWHGWLIVVLTVPLIAAGCGGFGDDEVAEPRTGGVDAVPAELNKLPEGIEEATIAIANGTFDLETLYLQEDEPTVLHVTNQDSKAYRLEITPALVTPALVAASATTDVGFTTPLASTYEVHLLPESGNGILATARVIVQSPGGVQP